MADSFGVRSVGSTIFVTESFGGSLGNEAEPGFPPGAIADDIHLAEVASEIGDLPNDRAHDPDEGLNLGGPVPHGNRDGVLKTQTTPAEVKLASGKPTGNLDFFSAR